MGSPYWCVHTTFGLRFAPPEIRVATLIWQLPETATDACHAYANEFNADTVGHELHHAHDAENAFQNVDDAYQDQHANACSASVAEAYAMIEDQIVTTIKDARMALQQSIDALSDEFHHTLPELGLDCERCRPSRRP